MPQLSVVHENLGEALGEVVQLLGGYKAVGARLWPDLQPDDAGRQLRHCLSGDRPEKLSLDQLAYLLRLGREKGAHGAMVYLTRACGYQDAVPVEPEDERAMLQREFIRATGELQRLARRLDGLREDPSLRAVS